MPSSEQNILQAYQYCLSLAHSHYENFPVASKLLNKKIRLPVSAVYAFARTADDFADEGNQSPKERLQALNEYQKELEQIKLAIENHNNKPQQSSKLFFYPSNNPIFTALADTIYKFTIPVQLFADLIQAFKQDVTTTRYADFNEILDYCRLSANPVGGILLHLNTSATAENLKNSDAICTGLQLINFYQDIAQDIIENDRLYLPTKELEDHQISIDELRQQINNEHTHQLLTLQIQRAKTLYHSGAPLCTALKGRFAIEIRMIFFAGKLILHKLEQNTNNIYLRPRLTRRDKLKILWQALFSNP
ncbi:squalene synthase HpnC [sulfur-oxidizing endosymbiont of Gigantopelta aegis]|uniref:squalene synthase HpnC n=1 Tax=sulfur-oxidizing endosymbiont of Gigantopelta aegis TaxID=2794934 RepID=UPI0018DDC36A|nr:squalene synthase HpnC [sulfur-oxidizing endosymbiont of Gigantopelta aegis]